MKKRLLATLTALCLIVGLFPSMALADGVEGDTNGNCGKPTEGSSEYSNNVTWSFDSTTGTLTISGTGEMADFENFVDTDGTYASKDMYEASDQYEGRKLLYYAGTTAYVSDTPWKDLGASIKSIVISEGVTNIGSRAFRLPAVTSVTIAHSVNSISDLAFDRVATLTTVIWVGDWSLAGHAPMKFDGFGNCTKLGTKEDGSIWEFSEWLPDCFTSMSGSAINGTSFSVDFEKLDAQLTGQSDGYGNSAFQNMPNLETATLDNRFGTRAFNGSGIKNLTISSDLASIPEYTCENCKSLTSVVIPSGVTSIGAAAFRGSGLTSLTFEGSSAVTFENQSFVTKEGSGPALSTLTLSENMSISDGSAIVNYLTGVGAVTDSTTITPSKFADALTEKLTVDGSLGAEITRKNYPSVTELTITGDSYTSAVSAFSVASGGTGKLKTLEIDVSGTATINATTFIREALESVKISASELKLTGDAAFLNNSALSHIDLTDVKAITTNGAERTFHIDSSSTAASLARYVYLNDVACYEAIQSHLTVDSSKGTSTCLITNGGTLAGSDGSFSTVKKEGYTAIWYVYSKDETNHHGTQVTNSNDTPTKGTTYIVDWTLDSTNYVEVTYKDGYTAGSGVTEAVAKSNGTLAGADTFIRSGYTLTGWKVENGDATYELGATVSPTSNITLVAQWTLDAPTIEASANNVTYGTNNVTLTAKTAAEGASYQWYKDNAGLSGKTGETLTLTDVADSGSYTVKITVGTDTAASDAMVVTITKAPSTISISADKASLPGGGTVMLTVDKSGLPAGAEVTVTCNNTAYNPTLGADGIYTVSLPNSDAVYTFTASYAGDANHEAASAVCTVNVTVSYPYVPVTPTQPTEPDEPDQPDEPDTPVIPGALPFVDVSNGDWFYDSVAYVYAEGIMTGSTASTFAPNDAMTRAMVWTVLGRMDGEDVEGGTPWYALAQSWAVSSNVSDGTGPNDSITREQLVTMLYRQAGSPEVGVSELALLGRFTDGEAVSSWAEEAMAWAVAQGILTGDGDLLKPQATATRAQVAAILARYCQNIQK